MSEVSSCALITGASKGIGAAIAIAYARAHPGCTLFLGFNSDREGADKVAKESISSGASNAFPIQSNLSSEFGCHKLVNDVRSKLPSGGGGDGDGAALDLLVNNHATTGEDVHSKETTWKELRKVVETNSFAMAKITALCLPMLELSKRSPSVVNMSSIVTKTNSGTPFAYMIAKGAVDALTRFQARELGPKIRVNAICPGHIDTTIHLKMHDKKDVSQEMINITPMKRLGTSEDIATAVLFLADNTYMTGASLAVNGGLCMY